MVGRQYSANNNYRFGFNGKENDNEVKGEGNQQDYGMRIYDPRLGRFVSLDPLSSEYSDLTPYQFSHNNPIALIDIDGQEGTPPPLPNEPGKTDGEIKQTTSSWEVSTPGGQPGCADCTTKTVTATKDWYWYSGNLDREAKKGWYAEDEYKQITQDWENGQVLQPGVGMAITDIDEDRSFGGRDWNGFQVNDQGYLTGKKYVGVTEINGGGSLTNLLKGLGNLSRLRQIAPGLFKKGAYTVYRGFKDGVLYIGKTAYTVSQRYSGKIKPEQLRAFEGLDQTIPNNGVAKGVEQLIMNLNGWSGSTVVLANQRAATINKIYVEVAKRWLNSNIKDWENTFKIIK